MRTKPQMKKKKGKYKALMLDVDGTLIPYDYSALPSKKVTKSIKKIRERIEICLVTGRSLGSIAPILEKLELNSGFAVLDNGARVVDIKTKELIYDQPISIEDAKLVAEFFYKEKMPFYLKQDLMYAVSGNRPTQKSDPIISPHMFYLDDIYTSKQVESVFKRLSHLKNLKLYKIQHRNPGRF